MNSIFKVDGKVNIGNLIISILLSEGVGFIAGIFNQENMKYIDIKKPFFSPPAYVFPIVWVILYFLMAVAAYRIWMLKGENVNIKKAIGLYLFQLALNFLWPFLFFKFSLYGLAFVEIIILFIFIFLTTIKFSKLDKKAGYLMVPYLIWVGFAAVLNLYIWYMNEM